MHSSYNVNLVCAKSALSHALGGDVAKQTHEFVNKCSIPFYLIVVSALVHDKGRLILNDP